MWVRFRPVSTFQQYLKGEIIRGNYDVANIFSQTNLSHSNYSTFYAKAFKTMSEHRLHEITIERPRSGMRISSRRLAGVRKNLDRLTYEASNDGFLSPYLIKVRQKTKSFSDHLAPLKRFLHSKVGQSWNEVYSELCKTLDNSTLSGQHILSHVWGYVERHAEIVDGIPFSKPSTYRGGRRLGGWRYDEFYIHPDTGILCLAGRTPREPPKKRDDFIQLDATRHYRKLDGIWYQIVIADIPKFGYVWDVILKASVSRERNGSTYAAQKRQCNKKEVRWIAAKLAKLNGDVA
jgi:hypothetical protein